MRLDKKKKAKSKPKMEEENKKMFDDDDFFDPQKNNKKAKAKLVDKTSTNETSPGDKILTKGNKAKKDKSGTSSNVRLLIIRFNPSSVCNFYFIRRTNQVERRDRQNFRSKLWTSCCYITLIQQ